MVKVKDASMKNKNHVGSKGYMQLFFQDFLIFLVFRKISCKNRVSKLIEQILVHIAKNYTTTHKIISPLCIEHKYHEKGDMFFVQGVYHIFTTVLYYNLNTCKTMTGSPS